MAKPLEKYEKQKSLSNSLLLRDKKGVFCLYNNIDWIDLRVSDSNPVLEVFRGLSVNSSSFSFDFGWFTAEYRWFVQWDSLICIDFLDINAKKVGQLLYKVFSDRKKNKNMPSKISFDGVFFTFYNHYFQDFLDFFWIKKTDQNLLLRVDYCVDLCGVSVDTLYRKYRCLPKTRCLSVPKPIYATDTGLVTTYTYKTDTNDIQIYDKKLDILMKWKYKLKNEVWDTPWNDYLKIESPISRIEVRWNAHSWYTKKNASIEWLESSGLQLCIDYIKNFYQLDLSVFFQDYDPKNIKLKKDVVNAPILEHKKMYALRMFKAYAKSCEEFFGFETLQEEFYELFENKFVAEEIFDSDFEKLSTIRTARRKQELKQSKVYFSGNKKENYEFEYSEDENSDVLKEYNAIFHKDEKNSEENLTS